MLPVNKAWSTNHDKLWQDTRWSGSNVGKMKALSSLLFNIVSVHTRMDKMSAEGTSANNYNYNSFIKKALTVAVSTSLCSFWNKVMIIKINYHLNAMPNKILIHWKAFWSFLNDCLAFSSCSTSVTSLLGLFPFSCSCGSAEVDRSPWRCVLTTMLRLGDNTYHYREDRRQLHSWCTWMS